MRKNCLNDSMRCIFVLRLLRCDWEWFCVMSLLDDDRDSLTWWFSVTVGRPSRNLRFVRVSMTVSLSKEKISACYQCLYATKYVKYVAIAVAHCKLITCSSHILHHCNPPIKLDTVCFQADWDIWKFGEHAKRNWCRKKRKRTWHFHCELDLSSIQCSCVWNSPQVRKTPWKVFDKLMEILELHIVVETTPVVDHVIKEKYEYFSWTLMCFVRKSKFTQSSCTITCYYTNAFNQMFLVFNKHEKHARLHHLYLIDWSL